MANINIPFYGQYWPNPGPPGRAWTSWWKPESAWNVSITNPTYQDAVMEIANMLLPMMHPAEWAEWRQNLANWQYTPEEVARKYRENFWQAPELGLGVEPRYETAARQAALRDMLVGEGGLARQHFGTSDYKDLMDALGSVLDVATQFGVSTGNVGDLVGPEVGEIPEGIGPRRSLAEVAAYNQAMESAIGTLRDLEAGFVPEGSDIRPLSDLMLDLLYPNYGMTRAGTYIPTYTPTETALQYIQPGWRPFMTSNRRYYYY